MLCQGGSNIAFSSVPTVVDHIKPGQGNGSLEAMTPPLPPEIIHQILQDLSDSSGLFSKTNLNQCALVCRAWLPKARSLVFHTIAINPGPMKFASIRSFLRLCNSPLETLSQSGVQTLRVSQYLVDNHKQGNQCYLERLLNWRSCDGKRTIRTILPNLKRLSLMFIDWRTISEEGMKVLLEGFKSVAELELYQVNFDSYDEFTSLLHSMPLLHSLDMTGCGGPSPIKRPPVSDRPLGNLKNVSIRCLKDTKLLRALVPSPNLRVFRCYQPPYASDGEVFEASDVNGLLESASSSLEEFVFEAGYTTFGLTTLGEYHPFAYRFHAYHMPQDRYLDELDLTKYPSLRLVDLTIMTPRLVDILDRLARPSNNHHRSRLKVLRLPYLNSIVDLDWTRLDQILQRPYFSELTTIECSFCCIFSPDDVVNQPRAIQYDAPDPDSFAEYELQARLSRFRQQLPMCDQRGILDPQVDYWYTQRL
ncbi:hypothetical protein VNI00_005935 [Paramarasmius palmivorus]|uniref:F-box domain-containing protein n=1 Tax=Paramarasmius palmivorus TaxID=297713 RepID=A0AAW0DDX3_9AGAR